MRSEPAGDPKADEAFRLLRRSGNKGRGACWIAGADVTWNPAARAILASAASPEVHSTGISVRMRSSPSAARMGE